MIDRYSYPEMARIWDFENKFDIWKEIEVLACEAQVALDDAAITAEEAAEIRAKAIVEAVSHFNDPRVIAEVSKGLGDAMRGIQAEDIDLEQRYAERGY